MHSLIKEYTDKIAGRKAYWIPLLFYTFGAYGFSMLNRTLGADDLGTPLYVNDTVWLQDLRWGAVLWKKLFSFGSFVPFLDKFLSICFLMLAGTAFSCLLYLLNGKRERVLLYTIASCSFLTFPIICEIWEFTCGGTLIVPGDFFCIFMILVWLLCRITASEASSNPQNAASGASSPARPQALSAGRRHPRQSSSAAILPQQAAVLLAAGVLMTPVISSAESIAPVSVTTVLIILFYRYCIQRTSPERKSAWFFEGVRFAIPLVTAFALRLIIAYSILAVLGLERKHTGATRIEWFGMNAEKFAALIKGMFINYGVASLINFPITVFVICAVLFALRCILLTIRRRSALPVFLGICIGLSLFLITLIQGSVMLYRTAITLMVFCAFVFYLFAETFYAWINAGIINRKTLPVLAGRCGLVFLLFITWRQAAHLHRFLALNNLRYDNETAVMQEICYTLSTDYDTSKPLIFVGNFSNGDAMYYSTHDSGKTRAGAMYRKIRHKIDGTPVWKSPLLVQSTVSSASDFYHEEFDGRLMGEYIAYYGYDFNVPALSRDEHIPYNEEAAGLGMKPFNIADRGDYILICIGSLD